MAPDVASFGPTTSPVRVAAWSSELATICGAIESICEEKGTSSKLLIQGSTGTGKTRLCVALTAAADAAGIEHLFMSPSPQSREYVRLSSPSLGLIICDDIDRASPSLVEALARSRGNQASWMVTSTSQFVPPVLDWEDVSVKLITIPSFDDLEDSGVDSIADLLFQERSGVSLGGCLADEALTQLRSGPWPRNGHTVAALVDKMTLLLELDGSLVDGELLRSISIHDISGPLLEVIREERREIGALELTMPVLAVEGITDKILLEAAAATHIERTGEDLLDGLEIHVCDGASRIPKALLALEAERRLAIGLLDSDDIGVGHKKAISKVGLRAMTIPLESGPLHDTPFGREVEIEDLLPAALLTRFYSEHPDREPETEIRHRGRIRIVPSADDKYDVASWCALEGSESDFAKILQLLVDLRGALGLPKPRMT